MSKFKPGDQIRLRGHRPAERWAVVGHDPDDGHVVYRRVHRDGGFLGYGALSEDEFELVPPEPLTGHVVGLWPYGQNDRFIVRLDHAVPEWLLGQIVTIAHDLY